MHLTTGNESLSRIQATDVQAEFFPFLSHDETGSRLIVQICVQKSSGWTERRLLMIRLPQFNT